MKCHCGLECEQQQSHYFKDVKEYYRCPKHGFQGWVDTKGFEYLD